MKKGKDRSAKAFFSVEENAREMVKLAFSELGIDAEPKDVKVEDPVVSYLDDNLSLEKLVEDHRIQPKQTTYFNQTKYHRFQPKYGRVQSKYDYFLIFGNLGVVPKSTCVTILFFPL